MTHRKGQSIRWVIREDKEDEVVTMVVMAHDPKPSQANIYYGCHFESLSSVCDDDQLLCVWIGCVPLSISK